MLRSKKRLRPIRSLSGTFAGKELRCDLLEGLRDARFHARCGVLFDGSVLCGLVDSLVESRERLFSVFYVLCEHEFARGSNAVLHRLLAARVKNVASFGHSFCLLC